MGAEWTVSFHRKHKPEEEVKYVGFIKKKYARG